MKYLKGFNEAIVEWETDSIKSFIRNISISICKESLKKER